MKKFVSIVLALSLLSAIGVSYAEGPGGGPNGFGGMRGGGGGMTDKSGDAELQTMITEVAPKFQLMTYEDAETGTSLQYQLYIPEDYDESQSYPLIQFIPDSSVVGKGTDAVLTQGWGGLIWATDAEQAKHPAFVAVPVFTETIVDDNFNHSGQIDVAMRMLQSLTETYSIDTGRIYTTGQSMGGMTSFNRSSISLQPAIRKPPQGRLIFWRSLTRTTLHTAWPSGVPRMTQKHKTRLLHLFWQRGMLPTSSRLQ